MAFSLCIKENANLGNGRIDKIIEFNALYLVLCDSRTIVCMDPKSGSASCLLTADSSRFLTISVYQKWLICVTVDNRVYIYDLEKRELFFSFHLPTSDTIHSVLLSVYRIVFVFSSGRIIVASVSGLIVGEERISVGDILCTFELNDVFYVINSRGIFYSFSLSDVDAPLHISLQQRYSFDIPCAYASYSSGLALIVSKDGHFYLIDAHTGTIQHDLKSVPFPVYQSVLFSSYLLYFDTANSMAIWSLESNQLLSYESLDYKISCLFADEENLIAGDVQGNLRFLTFSAASDVKSSGSISSHSYGDTAIRIWESEEGRHVEGTLVGNRSLHYSPQLQSMKKCQSARTHLLLSNSSEYMMKLPQLSLEDQNEEEYLFCNRMLEMALFNEEDVEMYQKIEEMKRLQPQPSNRCEEEISESLKRKLNSASGTVVIDDAENALMDIRSSSESFECGSPLKPRQDVEREKMRLESDKVTGRRSWGRRKSIPRKNVSAHSTKSESSKMDDDFQLYDFTNMYSVDEIARLRSKSKEASSSFQSKRQTVTDSHVYTITMRRQKALRDLFSNSVQDQEEYQYLVEMISRLGGNTDGVVRLPKLDKTPENLHKLREYLHDLNLSFDQINELLGDE